MEKIFKAIAENKDLRSKLSDMWKSGAKSSDMADVLADAGIDVTADEIEGLLAKMQERRAKVISLQKLEHDNLEQVAGGGTGICEGEATCDSEFKIRPNIDINDRCWMSYYCDSYYDDPCGYPFE